MSAWYVLSAMGFYPVNPASGVYIIGAPHFERVAIEVGHKIHLRLFANNVSDANIYIQSAKLNGAPLDRCLYYITKRLWRAGR